MRKKIIRREDGKAYLVRYTLFNFGFIGCKVHHILLSDEDCMHDHPWRFISIIIKGGYYETLFRIREKEFLSDFVFSDMMKISQFIQNNGNTLISWRGPGSILFRNAKDVHRITLPKDKTSWSLVFTFKKTRDWGFITKNGWIYWKSYIAKGGCQ